MIAAVLIIRERTKPVTVSWYALNALCKRFAIQEHSSQLVWMYSLHIECLMQFPPTKYLFKCEFDLIFCILLTNSSFSLFFQSFLYRCVGVILQQCHNKELVKKQLQEILISTRHNDAIERTVHRSCTPHTYQFTSDFWIKREFMCWQSNCLLKNNVQTAH